MHDAKQLMSAGKAAAKVLKSQAGWVHRRVERITFPSPEEPVYRRHVSVDFSIPEGLVPVQVDERPARFYVPLSLVLKWPPLLRLDLRDGNGSPLPFLTGKQNAILDEAVLVALAADATGTTLSGELRQAVGALTGERVAADRALRTLLPSPTEVGELHTLDSVRTKLRESSAFVGAAGGLRDSTFLWLRVTGAPGDREIVKFSYDIPMAVDVGSWSAASFGFRAFIADFDSPHLGSSSSYHLTISAPASIKVIDSEILLHKAPEIDDGGAIGEPPVYRCATASIPQRRNGLTMYTEPVGDQGRFYLAGERDGWLGKARVALIADKTLPRNGALAAGLIAALLTAYSIRLEEVLSLDEAAVTLALVAPALLAYLLVRPAQHEFARSFTTGIRRTLAFSGLLPILGATSIVLSGGCPSTTLCDLFVALSALAWIATGVLILAAILPRGKRSQPLSSYHDGS